MGDALKKVQSGQKLAIPARAYNAFIDAAMDYRRRTSHLGQTSEPTARQASIVLVRNDSGADRGWLEVLGIDGPVIEPSANLNEFKSRVALAGTTPAEGTHEGRFVVLAEPIAEGRIGRAYVAGVCPVKIDVADEDDGYAEIGDGETAHLASGTSGSARILWKETGTGARWAVVRIGHPIDTRAWVFPVNLTRTGGSQGTSTAAASWSYTVRDAVTDETLATAINPAGAPHVWRRPIGQMHAASAGLAYHHPSAGLIITWVNEYPVVEECPEEV